jgi:bacteriocin-like protein
MDADRELTDEELENVIGGASRNSFLDWVAKHYNIHRKNENDKQIYEKPTRSRND